MDGWTGPAGFQTSERLQLDLNSFHRDLIWRRRREWILFRGVNDWSKGTKGVAEGEEEDVERESVVGGEIIVRIVVVAGDNLYRKQKSSLLLAADFGVRTGLVWIVNQTIDQVSTYGGCVCECLNERRSVSWSDSY